MVSGVFAYAVAKGGFITLAGKKGVKDEPRVQQGPVVNENGSSGWLSASEG
jgi:hypothetical protein